MPITILSPYSGKPVKVRDQDVGRAIRDEEGRIFYIVDATDGGTPYSSMTRKGSEKDEQRYRKLESGSAQLSQTAREHVHQVHDATGKKRRNPVGVLLLVLILALAGGAAYVYFVRPDLVPGLQQDDSPDPNTPGAIQGEGTPGEGTPGDGADAGATSDAQRQGRAAIDLRPRVIPTHGPREPSAEPEFYEDPPLVVNPEDEVPEPVAVSEPEEPTAERTWQPGGAQPVTTVGQDPLEGFRVTRSGMRYRIIEPGEGTPAAAGLVVEIRYTARDLEGVSLIDDARHRFVLAAGQAIRALDEGLAGVRPGGQRELFVPKGHSTLGALPGLDELPDEAFVMDVEVLSVREGVGVTVVQEGVGEPARPGDWIEMDYAGWVEGRADPFDSSELRGGPMTLTLGDGGVIAGLEAGLRGIRMGEVRELSIPPYLGYGEAGVAGGLIPPNAVLTFRVRARSVRTPTAE